MKRSYFFNIHPYEVLLYGGGLLPPLTSDRADLRSCRPPDRARPL